MKENGKLKENNCYRPLNHEGPIMGCVKAQHVEHAHCISAICSLGSLLCLFLLKLEEEAEEVILGRGGEVREET